MGVGNAVLQTAQRLQELISDATITYTSSKKRQLHYKQRLLLLLKEIFPLSPHSSNFS